MNKTVGAHWYVVHTQVNGEAKAAQVLFQATTSCPQGGFHGEVAVPVLDRRRHGNAAPAINSIHLWASCPVATERIGRCYPKVLLAH
jgi:hypothetical protein